MADWPIVGLLIVARIALGLLHVSLPGLQNDEVVFVNAATLQLPGPTEFLYHEVLGIPLMVFPYTGALKSWLYIPIFSVFGESATSIRLPMELLTCSGLLLLYGGLRTLTNRSVALLALVLLCFDNSLFWLTRLDVGPTALEFFLKCAGLYCAARLFATGRTRWLLLLLLTLALGLFNKLNYIWIVNAAVVVSIGLGISWRRRLRRLWGPAAVWVAGLALIYLVFAAYYFSNHIGAINGPPPHTDVLSHNWLIDLRGTVRVLSGTWFFGYALAPIGRHTAVFDVAAALFSVGAVASVVPGRTRSPAVAAMAAITVIVALQILFTYQATAGWHYISIYPFATVAAAHGAWALTRALRLPRLGAGIALAAVAVAALSYDGLLMAKYFRQLNREPAFSAWSPAIYGLSSFLSHRPGQVFTADWGIRPPLFALDPSPRWHELAFQLQQPIPSQWRQVGAELASIRGPKLVIAHAPGAAIFRHANLDLARAAGKHLRKPAVIRGPGGVPVFLVYSYR